MGKAILVMDMPECCAECRCCNERQDILMTECVLNEKIIDGIDIEKQKADWCPLNPAPSKIVSEKCSVHGEFGLNKISEYAYARGYNDFINEIIGE